MSDEKETAVAAFDPNRLKEELQARVRDLFLQVIPDEQWDALIEKEIKSFFEIEDDVTIESGEIEQRTSTGFHHQDRVKKFDSLKLKGTAFRAIVYEALRPIIKGRIDTALAEDQFDVRIGMAYKQWVDAQGYSQQRHMNEVGYLGLFMEQQLEKLVPLMAAEMFKGIFANAAQTVVSAIKSGDPTYGIQP